MAQTYDYDVLNSYINSFFNIDTEEENINLYNSHVVEQLLYSSIDDFSKNPKIYQDLSVLLLRREAYDEALSVFEKLSENLPENVNGFHGRLNCLVLQERFEEANALFNQASKKLKNSVTPKVAREFLNSLVKTKIFSDLSNSDLDAIFFVPILAKKVRNLNSISRIFLDSFFSDYINIANKFVSGKGGKLIYVSLDNLFHMKDKTEFEKQLLAERIWERMGERQEWLTSCPDHVRRQLEDIPQFSEAYLEDLFSGPSTAIQSTRICLSEFKSTFVNTDNGLRRTTGQPSSFDNSLFVFGGSDVYGFGCEDAHTISSFLQDQLNQVREGRSCRVENHGIRGYPLPMCLNNLFQTVIAPNDIVVLLGYPEVDPSEFEGTGVEFVHVDFRERKEIGEVFIDHSHLSWRGNKVIAKRIIDQINKTPASSGNHGELDLSPNEHGAQKSVEIIKYLLYKISSNVVECGPLTSYMEYVKDIKVENSGSIGSVAVNCNPMTLGHLHLLEYAAGEVDFLYVFVIEEDQSFFSFADRFEIVSAGLAHLDNVKVIKGGRYICTELTFPEYFSKEEVTNVVADASMEAWFFCEYIAKALDITKIFLGEEPNCVITSQYNEKMVEILPQYGIEVDIIPRISKLGNVISASAVRRFLASKDFESIKEIVPNTTYQYLVANYSD